MKLLGNSRDREIVQNMSPVDRSLITGSIWLAFITVENALDSQNCFITSHIEGWVIIFFVYRCYNDVTGILP